jgi:hypothetical protein
VFYFIGFILCFNSATGFWIVELDPDYFAPSNNGQIIVSIAGSSDNFANVIYIHNVSYGDVFLCSGCVFLSVRRRPSFGDI